MPIYEYVCNGCRHEFEELRRSMNDTSAVSCPNCGADQVERRMSVFAAGNSKPDFGLSPAPGGCGRCGDPAGPCGS